MAFPTTLTGAVDGSTEIVADHLNHLESKVGIDSSADSTSLDYKIKNTSSIEPGHKHYKLYNTTGSSIALSVDSSANIGIGATAGTSAQKVLAMKGSSAPSTSPTDTIQLWSADRGSTAGKAALHMRTEDGTKHVFGDYCGLATFTPTILFDCKGKIGFATDGSTYWANVVRFTAGTALAQGALVQPSSTANDTVIKSASNSRIACGVVLAAAAYNTSVWVAVGGIIPVQFKTGNTPTRNHIAFASSVSAYAHSMTASLISATAATNWRVIGTVMQSASAGAQARVLLRFN